jgi:hypothetical protein
MTTTLTDVRRASMAHARAIRALKAYPSDKALAEHVAELLKEHRLLRAAWDVERVTADVSDADKVRLAASLILGRQS